MSTIDQDRLCTAALEAARNAYAPYSRFRVGAALLCPDGTVVTGTNVENRSYGLTICAERSAIVAAIAQGIRSFVAIAIGGLDADYPLPPCGACRQVLSEFLPREAPVFFCGRNTGIVASSIAELYPYDSLEELAADQRPPEP